MNRALPVAGAVGALAVAVTGATLTTLGARQLSHEQQLAHVRAQALAAGRQIAVDVADYDYRTIDRDFTRVSNEATGSFLKDFSTQAAGVRDAIVAAKAVSKAQIASAGIVNASANSAQVIAALDRIVTNVQSTKGTSTAFGLQIFLVKRNGRWLASQVNPL
jgi:Mce-associated membrane protein